MKKRILTVLLIIVIVIFAVWLVTFAVDYNHSATLRKPVFAKEYLIDATNDTIIYKGVGYKIEVKYYENGIECVEMKMFDKVISASIT